MDVTRHPADYGMVGASRRMIITGALMMLAVRAGQPGDTARNRRPDPGVHAPGASLRGRQQGADMATARQDDAAFPDGLDPSHAEPVSGLRAHASPLAFIILGAIVATAMTGALGGAPAPVTTINAPAAVMEVKVARPLRSGLFFETHIRVVARQDIAKPVIGIDAALWRDLTINSQIPAPSDESFADGQYRFDYPALKAGDTLEIKIDGQTNPPLVGRLAGTITLLDGDTRLSAIALSIPVLP